MFKTFNIPVVNCIVSVEPSFASVAKALRYYQEAIDGIADPAVAFKDLSSLTSSEPVA